MPRINLRGVAFGLIIMGLVWGVVVVAIGQAHAFTEKYWHELECAICAKDIYEQRKMSYIPYMPSHTYDPFYATKPGEEATSFSLSKTLICSECVKRYQEDYFNTIKMFYKRLRQENANLIRENRRDRKIRAIAKTQAQIKTLQDQAKALEEKMLHEDRSGITD